MANLLQSEPLFFTVASLSTLLFLASFLYLLLLGGDHGGADAGGHFDAGGGHVDAGAGHVDAGDGSVFDGSADAQHLDGSVDGQHLDSALSFKLFTTQSILAFLMGFGWFGLACRQEWHLPYLLSVPVAAAFGATLMFFTAYLMSQVYRLNAVRTRNLYQTLGDDAKVYLTIPEDGRGKVQAVVDGGLKTLDAVSKSGRIEQFKDVEIVGVEDQSTLIVREK
jgi:hypothetical protein